MTKREIRKAIKHKQNLSSELTYLKVNYEKHEVEFKTTCTKEDLELTIKNLQTEIKILIKLLELKN